MILVADLARQYGITTDELRRIAAEEGVDIGPKTKELYSADEARMIRILDALAPEKPKPAPKVKVFSVAPAKKETTKKETVNKPTAKPGAKKSAAKAEPVGEAIEEAPVDTKPKIKIFASLENMQEVGDKKAKNEEHAAPESVAALSGTPQSDASRVDKFKSKSASNQTLEKSAKKSTINIAAMETMGSVRPDVKKKQQVLRPGQVNTDMIDDLGDGGPQDDTVDMRGSAAVIQEVEQQLEREVIREQKKIKAQSDRRAEEKARERARLEAQMQPREGLVDLPGIITVKEFSEKIQVPAGKVIAALMKNGLICTLNHKIDYDTASIIASEFNVTVKRSEEDFSSRDLMEGNVAALLKGDDADTLVVRPPIVSIMGHVDHGKTRLLDSIRDANIIATEAGGITQKIGAYQATHDGRLITFLDTPGHEAFAMMRSRGAQLTDIAVLVVAADEGVKPQTKEAYEHIKDAEVPLIVAITKMDKPEANVDLVKGQLGELGIVPEDWGGDTIVVPVSAVTRAGVDKLLEMILLTADLNEFKANPDRSSAIGVVIESHLDPNLGPLASILIRSGTLNVGDSVVVGETYGRIKTMQDFKGTKVKEAGPSTPILVAGLDEVPTIGSILQEEKSMEVAKKKAAEMKALRQTLGSVTTAASGMEAIISKIHSGELKTLKIVLKADSKGSLEAIKQAVGGIKSDEVEASIVASNVGNITENDILMARAGGGIVMGFNVDYPGTVKKVAERDRVEVRTYQVIYQLIEEVEKILLGLLDPEQREIIIGELEVLAIFLRDKKGLILGGRVTSGKAMTKTTVRVFHGEELIGECPIASLKREKDNVSEVGEGYEAGLRLDTKLPIEVGDKLQFYKTEQIKREKL